MKFLYRLGQAILIVFTLFFLILSIASISDGALIIIFLIPMILCILGIILLEKKYNTLLGTTNKNNISNTSIPKRVDSGFINNNITPVEPVKPKPIQNSVVVPQTKSAQVITKEKTKEIYRPVVVTSGDDTYLRYFYKYVKIAINPNDESVFDNINIGDKVELCQEPTNEYDKNAVAVYVNNMKRGYIYKGTLQKMCNKWITNNDIYVISKVTDIDIETKKIYIYLAFYDILDEQRYENKFKVTLSENKYNDNCILEYEPLYISYDYDKEKYLIEEWGTVPKSSTNFFENIDGNIDYTSFVENIKENDSGSYSITIVIVYTKSSYDK